MKATAATVHIRWMIRRDLESAVRASASSALPWSETDFCDQLVRRDTIGMVAEPLHQYAGQQLGFLVYRLQKTQLALMNFCVHPEHRRQGVGTLMVAKIAAKLSRNRRRWIVTNVPERADDALAFFKSQRFQAVGAIHGDDGDLIRMVRGLK